RRQRRLLLRRQRRGGVEGGHVALPGGGVVGHREGGAGGERRLAVAGGAPPGGGVLLGRVAAAGHGAEVVEPRQVLPRGAVGADQPPLPVPLVVHGTAAAVVEVGHTVTRVRDQRAQRKLVPLADPRHLAGAEARVGGQPLVQPARGVDPPVVPL